MGSRVTLPTHGRKLAGIPEEAESYFWVYPLSKEAGHVRVDAGGEGRPFDAIPLHRGVLLLLGLWHRAVRALDLAQARGDVLAVRHSPDSAEEHHAQDSERWQVSPGVRAVLEATRCYEVLLGHARRDLRENQHRLRPWG